MPDRCLTIAHRGASALAPENTLAAFRKAVEAGADMIEIDVHLTRDNRFVVIHDRNVKRTTDGAGIVTEMTLDEVKRLDAGSRFSPAFGGERILTLEEVIALTRDRITLNVEVKATHPSEEVLAGSLLDLLARAGMESEVLVSSFSAGILKELRKRSAIVRLGLLYNVSLSPIAAAKAHEASAIHPNVAVASPELLRKAREARASGQRLDSGRPEGNAPSPAHGRRRNRHEQPGPLTRSVVPRPIRQHVPRSHW